MQHSLLALLTIATRYFPAVWPGGDDKALRYGGGLGGRVINLNEGGVSVSASPRRRLVMGFCGVMFRPLAASAVLMMLGTGPAQGQPNLPDPRLYVLIVADTDSNLKDYVAGNRDAIKVLLKEAFATRPNNIELEVFDGARVTTRNILAYYNKLRGKVRGEDTLWFYYNGHGTMIQGRHHLAITADWNPGRQQYGLPRETLLAAMTALAPRLTVVTTDSCSNEFTKAMPQLPPVPKLPKASWPVINCLFFDHTGVVDLNGCQPEFFSWTYSDGMRQGACFTWALAKHLCSKAEEFEERFKVKDGVVSWKQFLEPVVADTNKLYQNVREVYEKLNPDDLKDESKRNRNLALSQKEQIPTLLSRGLPTVAVQARLTRNWLFGAELNTTTFASGASAATLGRVLDDYPAAKAGLRADDEIVEIDGKKLRNGREAYWAIDGSAGRIKLKYSRGGQETEIEVELKPVKPQKK